MSACVTDTVNTVSPFSSVCRYDEFHPIMLRQCEGKPFIEFATFNEAVDEFFSKLESQKIDMKTVQQVSVCVCLCAPEGCRATRIVSANPLSGCQT